MPNKSNIADHVVWRIKTKIHICKINMEVRGIQNHVPFSGNESTTSNIYVVTEQAKFQEKYYIQSLYLIISASTVFSTWSKQTHNALHFTPKILLWVLMRSNPI